MEDIGAPPIQRLSCLVCYIDRIDRVLLQVRAETQLGVDDRALQIIVPTNALLELRGHVKACGREVIRGAVVLLGYRADKSASNQPPP